MSKLIAPHGNVPLKPLLLPEAERGEELKRARTLKRVPMSSRQESDLLMLAMGAYTPLDGFMDEADWRGSTLGMRLASGLFWPIPITLSCAADLAQSIGIDEDVALTGGGGDILSVLTVTEKYAADKELECSHVYRTTDIAHPGVAKVMEEGPVNLAGRVMALSEGHFPATYEGLYQRPAETRAMFTDKGWSSVAAFQTRNPMHRSHEYLAKIAVEVCDGVLVHQVLGALKDGDIPAEVRIRAIDVLVEKYFVPNTVIQAGYPIEMRYAGPREALLHALFRQNFGCSHLVVGRDHAGVGDYYGPFDAHHIFDTLAPGSLLIQPLRIGITFYCHRCGGMATGKTCPHGDDNRLAISGTRLREMFATHETIPPEFSRPEVLEVLQAYYDSLA
ncbi:MAG: sulfate adenylyltransferase [Rhodospirillales bacterium]|jgi:sulfate adenylyltransferase|nr:sulfate adenylyltransferase [Rhodospirillales bacterium]